MRIETDYLVVGAGASGLAFADSLAGETDAELTLVDREPAPGGHWLHAYPFVRLHSPSAYYGVSSIPLGEDRVDEVGENAGYYERATGAEVREHFAAAASKLSETGRVRFLAEHEHLGTGPDGERVRDLTSGELHEVTVRQKVVDARYMEASVPATHTPSFEVSPGVRLVPVGELESTADSAASHTVLGSGKTAVDAVTWLLDNGVEPGRIRWVRPREAWFHHRRDFQPLAQVGTIMEGISLDAEAAARAETVEDLFDRLEASGRVLRIDPTVPATMYRGTMLSDGELERSRRIEDVVRLGRVRRIDTDRIVLEGGEVASDTDTLHVDCTALGLRDAPPVPVYQPGRIVIQQVRHNSPTFNAALIGWVEARRAEDAERNRLCPPNPYASRIEDWPRMMSRTWRTEAQWLSEPDLSAWLGGTRLNLLRALPDHAAEPSVQAAAQRYLTNIGPALKRLEELDGT